MVFQIKVEAASGMIGAKLGGLMTIDEAALYIAEVKRQFIIHRLRRYVMVIDVTDCPIQAQDVIRALGGHMATMPKATAIAVVTGDSVIRMQVRRLFTQPYARLAATLQAGRSWVLEGIEPSAASDRRSIDHGLSPAIARA